MIKISLGFILGVLATTGATSLTSNIGGAIQGAKEAAFSQLAQAIKQEIIQSPANTNE